MKVGRLFIVAKYIQEHFQKDLKDLVKLYVSRKGVMNIFWQFY